MALTKIGSIGINTGIAFAGVTTIATLNASDNVLSVGGTVNFVSDVSIGGTVSIAGTLTYEDFFNSKSKASPISSDINRSFNIFINSNLIFGSSVKRVL